MRRLPAETATLYAELLDQLTAFEARRAIGRASGSFVAKTIKGKEYYYFQNALPGGALRQIYIGRRTPELEDVVRRFASGRADAEADRTSIERICALLRVGGAATTDAAAARVIAALADAAVFRLGGVLVGTHAFIVLGNMLGVTWEHGPLRTDDVDVAAERALAVAVPELAADIPGTLEALEMGFLPVPGLSPTEPATSFKVRGRSLRVDLLTPLRGQPRGAVFIQRIRAAAQPLRYLDYLIEDSQPAAVVDGGGVLVHIPQPARFAVHKLIVARSRASAFQTKADKDVRQAAALIEVLAEDRPGDLRLALKAVADRGWDRILDAGVALLRARTPQAARQLASASPGARRDRARGGRRKSP
jgi:hypothetical protein